ACIFSNQKNIQEIPVLSLLEPPTEKGEFIKYKKANYTTISLPTELADKAKKQIEGTGFKNLSDFVTFLVREVASTKDKWDENKSMDQITKKLKALGYID
ncbi:MAG: ribbon-helix-helix domain-containing protein, partial [Candidatus Altiarchaeota archaeon]|nr:ribbon-helix-helix domain-containing protein [Candidatus Altiarchaeota archaeon]